MASLTESYLIMNGDSTPNKWYNRVYLCYRDRKIANNGNIFRYNRYNTIEHAENALNKIKINDKENKENREYSIIPLCRWIPERIPILYIGNMMNIDKFILEWKYDKIILKNKVINGN